MRLQNIFAMLLVFFLAACSVDVTPPLGTSLGYSAFSKMRVIEPRDVQLSLYIDENLKTAKIEQEINQASFTFLIGESFAAKLIKGAAYNFKRIEINNKPVPTGNDHFDAEMRVTLQDIDAQLDIKPGWSTVTTEGYTRLAVRAEIRDVASGRVVWVGTSQVSQEDFTSEFAQMTAQEAGRGFAIAIDKAVDQAIGDLLGQINKSQSLQSSFERWENRG